MLFPLATVLGLTGCSYVLGPVVSERRALPARSPDTTKIMRPFSLGRHLKLTRIGLCPGHPETRLRRSQSFRQFLSAEARFSDHRSTKIM